MSTNNVTISQTVSTGLDRAKWEAIKREAELEAIERYKKMLPRLVTVGDLKRMLKNVPSDVPVVLEAWDDCDDEVYVAIGAPTLEGGLHFEIPTRDHGWQRAIGDAVVIGARPKR